VDKVPVAAIEDLAPNQLKGVAVGAVDICLIKDGDGGWYAVGDICPHLEYFISEGGELHGMEVECPGHGSRFDIRSGEVTQGPADSGVPVYPVLVEDGKVYVSVAGESG